MVKASFPSDEDILQCLEIMFLGFSFVVSHDVTDRMGHTRSDGVSVKDSKTVSFLFRKSKETS